MTAAGSDVVETERVGAPAAGLVMPLKVMLTLWLAGIASPPNRPHLITVPLGLPQLPMVGWGCSWCRRRRRRCNR